MVRRFFITLLHFQDTSRNHDDSEEVESKKSLIEEPQQGDLENLTKQTISKQGNTTQTALEVKTRRAEFSERQIPNSPSLMDIPVNLVSAVLQPSKENSDDSCRNRNDKLSKTQMHQHNLCEANDINNQIIDFCSLKDDSFIQINACSEPIRLQSDLKSDLEIEIRNYDKSMEQNSSGVNTEKVGDFVFK